MKRLVTLFSVLLAITKLSYGQTRINNNDQTGSVYSHSAFLDASSSTSWNSTVNEGKGLLFPHTDLTAMASLVPTLSLSTNNPYKFDGMVVFNTATGTAAIGGTSVIPGFYYYRNTSATINGGIWVSMVPTVDNTVNTISFNATNGTIGTSNSTVFCTGTLTLTLPVATTVPGKIFRIIKNDTDNSVLTFSENIYSTATANFNTLNYEKSLVIQSNGSSWTVVN